MEQTEDESNGRKKIRVMETSHSQIERGENGSPFRVWVKFPRTKRKAIDFGGKNDKRDFEELWKDIRRAMLPFFSEKTYTLKSAAARETISKWQNGDVEVFGELKADENIICEDASQPIPFPVLAEVDMGVPVQFEWLQGNPSNAEYTVGETRHFKFKLTNNSENQISLEFVWLPNICDVVLNDEQKVFSVAAGKTKEASVGIRIISRTQSVRIRYKTKPPIHGLLDISIGDKKILGGAGDKNIETIKFKINEKTYVMVQDQGLPLQHSHTLKKAYDKLRNMSSHRGSLNTDDPYNTSRPRVINMLIAFIHAFPPDRSNNRFPDQDTIQPHLTFSAVTDERDKFQKLVDGALHQTVHVCSEEFDGFHLFLVPVRLLHGGVCQFWCYFHKKQDILHVFKTFRLQQGLTVVLDLDDTLVNQREVTCEEWKKMSGSEREQVVSREGKNYMNIIRPHWKELKMFLAEYTHQELNYEDYIEAVEQIVLGDLVTFKSEGDNVGKTCLVVDEHDSGNYYKFRPAMKEFKKIKTCVRPGRSVFVCSSAGEEHVKAVCKTLDIQKKDGKSRKGNQSTSLISEGILYGQETKELKNVVPTSFIPFTIILDDRQDVWDRTDRLNVYQVVPMPEVDNPKNPDNEMSNCMKFLAEVSEEWKHHMNEQGKGIQEGKCNKIFNISYFVAIKGNRDHSRARSISPPPATPVTSVTLDDLSHIESIFVIDANFFIDDAYTRFEVLTTLEKKESFLFTVTQSQLQEVEGVKKSNKDTRGKYACDAVDFINKRMDGNRLSYHPRWKPQNMDDFDTHGVEKPDCDLIRRLGEADGLTREAINDKLRAAWNQYRDDIMIAWAKALEKFIGSLDDVNAKVCLLTTDRFVGTKTMSENLTTIRYAKDNGKYLADKTLEHIERM